MSNRKTLLIAKGGSVYRTRESAQVNESGESGETEGVIEHLLADWQGYIQLVYFGQYRGEIPPGLTVIQPGRPDGVTAASQERCWAQDVLNILEVCESHPVAFLQTTGYSPTWSTINNPVLASIYASGIFYQGPMLNMIRSLELPRLLINGDPRCYPKDQEMSKWPGGDERWKHCRPVALLDQIAADDVPCTVGEKRYRRRSVYAGCERWAKQKERRCDPNSHSVVIAHAHVDQGIKCRSRFESWQRILDGRIEVYGKGWDCLPNVNYRGVLAAHEVADMFSWYRFTPVLSYEGFYTGKPFVAAAAGCVPLLTDPLVDNNAWDPENRYGLPWEWRIASTREHWPQSDSEYREQLDWWQTAAVPDWSILDRMLADLLDGSSRRPGTASWYEAYGGYGVSGA